jgi:hypothetical protein
VLISVMNVMLMSVYERVKEIGTIAAMGTMPRHDPVMFVIEGLSLGVLGVAHRRRRRGGAILGISAVGRRSTSAGRPAWCSRPVDQLRADALIVSASCCSWP